MKKIFFLLLLIPAITPKAGMLPVHGNNTNNSLVLWYTFDGDVIDKSGYNNNPVFNNAKLTTDRFGKADGACYFDGSTNFIKVPNSNSLNTGKQITISAWVRPDGFYEGRCHSNCIMMKGYTDHQRGNYLLRFDDGPYTYGTHCGNEKIDPDHQSFYGNYSMPKWGGYGPYIQKGSWYFITYTCDGKTAKLFVNGELRTENTLNNFPFGNSDDLVLGRMQDPQYPYWFNGALDELRIYNRALSEKEIQTMADEKAPLPCQEADRPKSKLIPEEIMKRRFPVMPCKTPADR